MAFSDRSHRRTDLSSFVLYPIESTPSKEFQTMGHVID